MRSSIADPHTRATVEQLDAALAAVQAFDVPAQTDTDLRALVEVGEELARRVASFQIDVLDAADQRRLGWEDGFFSAKTLVRHVGRLSPGRAAVREKLMRALRDLPEVAEALAAGEIGVEQAELLGKVHANQRVRDLMPDRQGDFIAEAKESSCKEFSEVVRRWERLVDEDGPEPANSRNHNRRNADLVQDSVDLGWALMGGFGALQGATMHTVFEHYIDAERRADWDKARAEHGDDALAIHLPRTEAQRRADAMWQIFQDAAKAPASAAPVGFCHLIQWDEATYEEMLRRFDGLDPRPLDPDTMRCTTIDGVPLEPTEAAANSLVNQVRRVVIDAKGVVIDLGEARFFTGNARLAVQLQSDRCVWTGCDRPASRCQADHLTAHRKGGRTCSENGINLCGGHNRLKECGYTVQRDEAGRWAVYRPDGSLIE